MPMMADLDDPPRARWPGFLIGLVIALPVGAAIAFGLLPFLYDQLTGDAEAYDSRLRQEDAYMQTLCTEAMLLSRDESLCSCALAIEYPSLDCRPQFLAWTLARQLEQCGQPQIREGSVSFCACVETVAEKAASAPDEAERRQVVQRYAGCTELDDVLSLPTIDTLVPTPAQLQAEREALARNPSAKLAP